MSVTVDQISTKEFAVVARGYDREEVDGFLDDIMDEMERMEQEIHTLQQQLAAAKSAAKATPAPAAPVARQPAQDGSAKALELIEMAQRLKDEAIAKAQNEANDIIGRAKEEAEKQIGGLSEQKSSLEQQIVQLKQAASDYRGQFEALLAAQQEALEKATSLF